MFVHRGQVYGCLRAYRKLVRLDVAYDDSNGLNEQIVLPRLNPPYAAFAVSYASGPAADTGFQDLSLWNLATGRRVLHRVRALSITNEEVDNQYGYSCVRSLVLTKSGTIAWIGEAGCLPADLREVWRLEHGHRTLLDSGLEIGRQSLKLVGNQLTWLHGSEVRTAPLGAAGPPTP